MWWGERRESSEVKVEDRIWYIHTLGPSVKLETKGKRSECNPVKGRSELETETTIWYFSETLLSCIILLNSWRHALRPWVLQFFLSGLHLLTDIYTHFVTGCLFKKKKKKVSHCPFYNRKCWSQMPSGPQWHLWVKMHIQMQVDFHSRGHETQWHLLAKPLGPNSEQDQNQFFNNRL